MKKFIDSTQILKDYLYNLDIDTNKEGNQIIFRKNDINFIFNPSKQDRFYFHLLIPNVRKVEEDKNLILDIINEINIKVKIGKGSIMHNNVYISIEAYLCSDRDKNRLILDRLFDIASTYLKLFRDMTKTKKLG